MKGEERKYEGKEGGKQKGVPICSRDLGAVREQSGLSCHNLVFDASVLVVNFLKSFINIMCHVTQLIIQVLPV